MPESKLPKVSRMSIEDILVEHAAMNWREKASGRGLRLRGAILHQAVMKGSHEASKYAESQHWNVRVPV